MNLVLFMNYKLYTIIIKNMSVSNYIYSSKF